MLFEYQEQGTIIHRLDPRTKTIWLAVVLVISILLRDPVLLVTLFCISLMPLLLIRIPRHTLIVLGILYLMVAAGAILSQALFYRPSNGSLLTFVWLVPPDVPVMGALTGGILISVEGALYGFIQVFRILAVINTSAMLVLSTPLNRLIVGLREMGMPGTMAFMLTTAVRFVPVLMEEYQTILSALRARNIVSLWHPVRMAEQSLSPLIINVIRRCNQLALAAESRAFDLDKPRTAVTTLAFNRADTGCFLLMGVIVLFFAIGSARSAGFLA
ncbi:MAG: Energy-coupling factor transporter transmembrane protein EcfT [Methanoregula sp. PtaU1.Bin051]|nr:MAG: Energy-coupling factor transporter transmembrane protein EcfT [Methanoregula sp. PtaU1.Bin051]